MWRLDKMLLLVGLGSGKIIFFRVCSSFSSGRLKKPPAGKTDDVVVKEKNGARMGKNGGKRREREGASGGPFVEIGQDADRS